MCCHQPSVQVLLTPQPPLPWREFKGCYAGYQSKPFQTEVARTGEEPHSRPGHSVFSFAVLYNGLYAAMALRLARVGDAVAFLRRGALIGGRRHALADCGAPGPGRG